MGSSNGALVAIVEGCGDIAELLRDVFEEEGFRAVVERHEDLARPAYLGRFLDEQNPWVFVWDIPPPLDAQWRLFEGVRRTARDRAFVVTSTNRRSVEKLALPGRVEILSKPFDLDEMLGAVYRTLEDRQAPRSPPRRAIA